MIFVFVRIWYSSVDKNFLFLHTPYVIKEKKIENELASRTNRNRFIRYWKYIEEPDRRAVLSLDSSDLISRKFLSIFGWQLFAV